MDQGPCFPAVKPQSCSLQNRIARIYYSHGLFCSSHPYSVIVTTLVILAICCYPLLRLPLLGSSSQHYTTPLLEYVPPTYPPEQLKEYKFTSPRWFQGPPVGYIQQIIIKSAVSPWKPDLILTDAFRAPLAEVFQIRQLINNHQSQRLNQSVELNDLCLQISEPIDKSASALLPSFQCLVVSLTNIWEHNFNLFQKDADIIKTVFSVRDSSVDPSSLREILFGVPWKETGIKQFNVRRRPRVLTFAFTIVFQSFDAEFLRSLLDLLKSKYTFSPYPENTTYHPSEDHISHIHFQDLHACAELIPLGVAYTILFLYIYFSVRKIDLVKSKWALAISAVMTVMMSLFMSVGLCLWFGLNPTLNGSEILPYLIVVIGLENMLVLTKSVVSTPVHLDVKLRVAQGLSKEGWSITKNLLTELALLTVAFLTFVPKIQEFCLFAMVGLLTDFFLQLVFFATFLSIDIRRIEITDLHQNYYRRKLNNTDRINYQMMERQEILSKGSVISHTKSRPSLVCTKQKGSNGQVTPAKVFAPTSNPVLELPKRLKFVYFWARTRIVQRGLMFCLVMWILFWAYSSNVMDRISDSSFVFSTISDVVGISNTTKGSSIVSEHHSTEYLTASVSSQLKHQNLFLWQSLSPQHWTTLFGYYNISLSGRYISVLPPLHLSIPLDSNAALELRTLADIETSKRSYWQFLSSSDKDSADFSQEFPYHSPHNTRLAIVVAVPTLLLVTYIMVILYRCMCTKHYAEWRSSWKNSNQSSADSRRGSIMSTTDSDEYLITETLPIKLHGHSQEVENIVTSENVIVSSCLSGNICVWDSISGDCITLIKRRRLTKRTKCSHRVLHENASFSSDSTYSSSPVSDDADHYLMYLPSPPISARTNSVPKLKFNMQTFVKSQEEKSPHVRNSPVTRYDFSKYVKRTESSTEGDCFLNENDEKMLSTEHRKENTDFQSSRSGEDQEYTKQISCHSPLAFQEIWSMDFYNTCIAVGCKDGRLEVWNAFTGNLEYIYDENKAGITAVALSDNNRLVAARLNGMIDFFKVEHFDKDQPLDISSIEIQQSSSYCWFHCRWLQSVKAHSLSVSTLKMDSYYVVSGGFDRLVKVFKFESKASTLDSHSAPTDFTVYTLHGHSAPISALHIDEYVPASAASGCQGGMVSLWDLMTGTCIYSLKCHQGEVMTLNMTSIYMISEGTDNRICIWEKHQGHLLHSITQNYCLHSNFELLTSNIMVTAKEDNLLLWDVNHGEPLRMIMVGNGDHSCHIKQLRISGQSVICDYGSQIFIVNFPLVTDKLD